MTSKYKFLVLRTDARNYIRAINELNDALYTHGCDVYCPDLIAEEAVADEHGQNAVAEAIAVTLLAHKNCGGEI